MKTRFIVIAFISLVLLSFTFSSCEDCITGNGKITSKSIKVGEISQISLSGDANLVLINDSSESITIEGESNIIEAYVFDEDGKSLKIKTEPCILKHQTVTITIPVRVLESLSLNGSGNISSKGAAVRAMDLEMAVNGSGDINLQVEADNIVNKINGSGDITLQGSAKNMRSQINGSGNLEAANLAAGKVRITINGSGDCRVMASSALDVVIRGSGNVYYKGTPDISTEVKGSGSVEKIN